MISWQKKKEEEKQRILDAMSFSWDQQPGEPNNAFNLFHLYLGIGKTRSYIKTCNLSNAMSYQTICDYSHKYNWKQRADDFDQVRDREMMIELDAEILKNKLRQLNIGKQLQELAEKGSEMLLENIEELSPADIVKLADTGTKLTNLALGSSTEITESKVNAKIEMKVESVDPEIAAEIGKLIAIKKSEDKDDHKK